MFVDQATFNHRYSTCQRCPYQMIWLGKLRCSICKCFMGIKARLASMHCPKGYW